MQVLRHQILDYPSGSALIFQEGKIFLIGDDSPSILCLDESWKELQHIQLLDYPHLRIPKPEKPDLESAVLWKNALFLLGSGSKSPQRDVIFKIDLSTLAVEKLNNTTQYQSIREQKQFCEMNIEGATLCRDKFLLFNRANTSQPNHVIITQPDFLDVTSNVPFVIQEVELDDQLAGYGISDAYYDEENDILLLSASLEETSNAYDDGTIKGSVLAYVFQAYAQLQQPVLRIEKFIDLNQCDPALHQQKIESLCVFKKTKELYHLFLVADNDDGFSNLFEVVLKKDEGNSFE